MRMKAVLVMKKRHLYLQTSYRDHVESTEGITDQLRIATLTYNKHACEYIDLICEVILL